MNQYRIHNVRAYMKRGITAADIRAANQGAALNFALVVGTLILIASFLLR